jgi:prepilin-type N-terminal cleavage/methylation domain-containing protein
MKIKTPPYSMSRVPVFARAVGGGAGRKGFTVVELVLVLGIVAVVSVVSFVGLTGRKGTVQLEGVVKQMGSMLREAQSKSLSQVSGTTWGVVFDNTTTSEAFYGSFSGASYTSTSSTSYYRLPTNIHYATSTIPAGSKRTIYFSQLSGLPSTTTSIGVFIDTPGSPSSTISVNPSGAISF